MPRNVQLSARVGSPNGARPWRVYLVVAYLLALGGLGGHAHAGEPMVIAQNVDLVSIVAPLSGANPSRCDRFYRRFELAKDHGITESFVVTSAAFGVENLQDADPNVGSPILTADVILHTIPVGAALTPANLTRIASTQRAVTMEDERTVLDVSILAGVADPTATDLVFEILANDVAQGFLFHIGANAAGQSQPPYHRGCGFPDIIDVTTTTFADAHYVMYVRGSQGEPIFGDGFESGDASAWSEVLP